MHDNSSRASLFNPNTNHHSSPNHHFSPSTAAGSLLEQVPTFADETRLSVDLDWRETPKEHVECPDSALAYPFLWGTETLAWMEEAVAWPSALTGRRRLCRS